MGTYVSDQNKVGFFYESGTYASESGNMQWIGCVTEHTIDEEENVEVQRYLGTASRNVSKFTNLARDVTGTITYNPQDWKFLGFAIGSVADTSGSNSTHTMTEANNSISNYAVSTQCLSTFALEDSKVPQPSGTGLNFIRTVRGAMVNTMSISASQGGLVEVSVDYVGQYPMFTSGASTAGCRAIASG